MLSSAVEECPRRARFVGVKLDNSESSSCRGTASSRSFPQGLKSAANVFDPAPHHPGSTPTVASDLHGIVPVTDGTRTPPAVPRYEEQDSWTCEVPHAVDRT